MQISRRNALLGAGAAAAVAGVPAGAQAGDVVLLGRIARFNSLYDNYRRVQAKDVAHRARIAAMPDCPGFDPPTLSRAYEAFMEKHDAYRYYHEGGPPIEQAEPLAEAIFKTPAETARGVLEKLKIAHAAIGDGGDTGDIDLEAYQDLDALWMETVIADFERLVGEA